MALYKAIYLLTYLRGTASFDVFCVKISVGASAVGERKNPPKNEHLGVIFHAYGEKKPLVGSTQNFALREISGM